MKDFNARHLQPQEKLTKIFVRKQITTARVERLRETEKEFLMLSLAQDSRQQSEEINEDGEIVEQIEKLQRAEKSSRVRIMRWKKYGCEQQRSKNEDLLDIESENSCKMKKFVEI